ncbi:MAG: sulfite exporter TauE/SafE family protein [Eubacteriales bacterium]
MEIILFFVAIIATTVGAISGMGGGIIIKPVMDAVSGMEVTTINFMSSCTVLGMAIVSIYRGRKDEIDINYRISTALALGACLGGVLGKMIFDAIPSNHSLIQSTVLFWLNIGIYFYVKFKRSIKTKTVSNLGACGVIGCSLGTISSFLGIGGGPLNIAILTYFFSSAPKVTARRSIFVILLSQISSILVVFTTGIPTDVNYFALSLMIIGGCSGAILGGKISKKLTDVQVDDFFTDVLVAIIILNAYNMGAVSA